VVTLTLPRMLRVTVTDDTLSVDREDGRTIAVPIGWYPRLAHGTPAERAKVQMSGAGDGWHGPALDEDIGVEGVLLGKSSTERAASCARWLQRRSARSPQETAEPGTQADGGGVRESLSVIEARVGGGFAPAAYR
jgi:hypothetical protein